MPPSELKARMSGCTAGSGSFSAWDLLGVGKDADAGNRQTRIRRSSKELHQNRLLWQNLGSFRASWARFFARLSAAMQEVEKSRKGEK